MSSAQPPSGRTHFVGLVVSIAILTLGGCVSVKMSEPTASPASVLSLRSANLAPARVGTFRVDPAARPDLDRKVGGLRGSSLGAAGGSFARQLGGQVAADLEAAGLLDDASATVIDGVLTDSFVDAAVGKGKGRLAARFTITRDARVVLDKALAVDATWESSFVGAIALPAAIDQYGAMYRTLAGKLYEDAEFRTAMAR
jgi:hypothetical protein